MLIFLIGFMGCGKSRMGRKLAEKMNLPLQDMDKVIEEMTGMTVAEFFTANGEEAFRKLENEYLKNLNPEDNMIVSTGGGVPCFYDNMDIMKSKGVTIFLNTPIESILKRVKRRPEKRPLLKPIFEKPEAEFDAIIKQRLESRMPFYTKADIIVTENKVSHIVRQIKEFKKKDKYGKSLKKKKKEKAKKTK